MLKADIRAQARLISDLLADRSPASAVEPSEPHEQQMTPESTDHPEPLEPARVLRRPPPVKFAAIDVGTNSVHLVMAEISPQGDFRIVGRDKEMVQIGKGGFLQHLLTPRAMEEGIATIKRFVKMAQLMDVTRIKAVATSAVREARNGGDFVQRVRDEIGLDLHVISAEQEARLIYLGVRHAVDLGRGDSLIVDIGGGSAELIVANADRPEILASAKLGGSRLAELFLKSDPPDPDELKRLRKHIDERLAPIVQQIQSRRFTSAIATSGTVQNIAAICSHQTDALGIEPAPRLRLARDELKELLGELTSRTRADRLRIPSLDPRRVDALIPATMLLLAIMRTFDIEVLRHCDLALREGIILEHIARHRAMLLARATWPDPRTRSVLHLAERCGYRKSHAEQVARLALSLYDQLAPLHRLDSRYRELLRYACLLHDIGYHIGHENHHKHSYYLIRNGELQGFEPAEIEIIANIARYHRKGRPRKSHYSYGNLDRPHREPVRKLIALLRLADALDRTHYCVINSLTVRLHPRRIDIVLATSQDAELELWTARKTRDFFEREFERPVEFVIAGQEEGSRDPVT